MIQRQIRRLVDVTITSTGPGASAAQVQLQSFVMLFCVVFTPSLLDSSTAKQVQTSCISTNSSTLFHTQNVFSIPHAAVRAGHGSASTNNTVDEGSTPLLCTSYSCNVVMFRRGSRYMSPQLGRDRSKPRMKVS